MRVLHMIPDIGISNGVMSVILNYYKFMPKDIRFDVIYFQEKKDTRQQDIEALGGRVFQISSPGVGSLLNHELNAFFDAHENEWQALHIHAPHFTVFIAPPARKHGIKRIAVHCHSTWYSLKKKNELRNRLLSLPAKGLSDMQFACGTAAGRFWFGGDENFTVLPNTVDCSALRFNPIVRASKRAEMKLNEKFAVGHVGRVDPPQKNHPFLLKIFAQIKKRQNNACLLLAGAEETQELSALAAALNLGDSVYFLGHRTDVDELLQAMDVFIFPSFKEGLPVSAIEAQAAGLPVLMADTITDEAAVTDRVQLLSLELSPEIWAEKALLAAAEERTDTYRVMCAAGWDIKKNAANLAAFYQTGVFGC